VAGGRRCVGVGRPSRGGRGGEGWGGGGGSRIGGRQAGVLARANSALFANHLAQRPRTASTWTGQRQVKVKKKEEAEEELKLVDGLLEQLNVRAGGGRFDGEVGKAVGLCRATRG